MISTSRVSMFAGAALLALAAVGAPARAATTTPSPAHASTQHHDVVSTKATPAAADQLAALKASLARDRQNLHAYHWTETTVVSVNGEERSKTVNSCSIDASGATMRTLAAVPATSNEKSASRSSPARSKDVDAQAYRRSAGQLIGSYLPLDSGRMERCKDAGKMTMTVVEPGKEVKYEFKDYEKPGDDLSLMVNPENERVSGMTVESYLSTAKEPVKVNADMASLADGTNYPSRIRLEVTGKPVAVTVTNSEYHKKST